MDDKNDLQQQSKYQWCICDMDGTLLDSQDTISEENETALKKLQQNGVEVIIASGRLDLMVKRYIYQLNLKGHVISCNGGLIRNIETGEIVYSKAMDKAAVKEIITYCIEKNVDYLLYTADLIYSTRDNPRAIRYEKMNNAMSENLRFPVEYIDDYPIKCLEDKDTDILKVLLICKNQSELDQLQGEFNQYNSLTVVSSAVGLLDIMATDTSKGKALQLLAERLNINLEHAIAFGDNHNDIDLLQSVGMPIAMENSVDQLKAVAKYITKSNDESGIGYAINKFIL